MAGRRLGKRKRFDEEEDDDSEDEIIMPARPASSSSLVAVEDVDMSELFERLKEFENKAMIDRLKLLERSMTLMYKEQLADRAMLREIKQIVSYLSLAHEELLNNLGMGQQQEDEADYASSSSAADDNDVNGDKKWN